MTSPPAEGFTDFDARPRRLRPLLDAYGYTRPVRDVLEAIRARIAAHVQDVRDIAAADDPLLRHLPDSGIAAALERAITQLDHDRALWALDD